MDGEIKHINIKRVVIDSVSIFIFSVQKILDSGNVIV